MRTLQINSTRNSNTNHKGNAMACHLKRMAAVLGWDLFREINCNASIKEEGTSYVSYYMQLGFTRTEAENLYLRINRS